MSIGREFTIVGATTAADPAIFRNGP